MPIDDGGNEGTASRRSRSWDMQLFAEERLSVHGEVAETSKTGRPASQLPIPIPDATTIPYQFHSQKLEPTSAYSRLAHNMRSVVADAIIRTHSDAHPTPIISLHTSLHRSSIACNLTAQINEKEAPSSVASINEKLSYSIHPCANAPCIISPTSGHSTRFHWWRIVDWRYEGVDKPLGLGSGGSQISTR
jgi:hypothetical protein